MSESALGDEIENVRGPVLNSDVLDFRTLESHEFNHGAVECGCLKLRRGAAFHIHDLAAFVGNDERAFKLAKVFGIDAEVGLQWMLHLHSWRDVDERTTRKNSAVQSREFVVTGRDDFAEPLAEDLRMFLEPFGGSHKDHALVAHSGFNIGVSRLAVELGFHAGEKFAFLLGNAEALEGALDVLRHIVPRALGLRALGKIIPDIFENNIIEIMTGPVSRHGHGFEFTESIFAKVANPIGVFFNVGDIVDRALRESDARVEFVVHIVVEVANRAVDIEVGFGFHDIDFGRQTQAC